MRLTDDNYHEYKAFYGIPDDFHMFSEHYHFGNCPSFRGSDTPKEDYLYVYTTTDGDQASTKVYKWSELCELLRSIWRPKSSDGISWYMNHVAA